MHFAYPPRKSSNPPPYLRAAKLPGIRRSRLRVIALAGLAFLALLYLLTRGGSRHGGGKSHTPSGNPPVVLVTVLDEAKFKKDYLDTIKENRIQYAQRHGKSSQKVFFSSIWRSCSRLTTYLSPVSAITAFCQLARRKQVPRSPYRSAGAHAAHVLHEHAVPPSP